MRFTTSVLALSLLAASPALASGYVAPPQPPAIVPVADTDWTGFYVGLGYGHMSFEDAAGFEDDTTQYSFFGGYLHDFGNVVIGAEIEYMVGNDWDISVNDEDTLTSLTGRVGYDLGRVLPYVSLGLGTYESSCCPESDTLTLLGVGADFQLNDNIRLGLNYETGTNDEFELFTGTPFDLTVNTFSVRAMFTF